jgi:hypothetical protein
MFLFSEFDADSEFVFRFGISQIFAKLVNKNVFLAIFAFSESEMTRECAYEEGQTEGEGAICRI